MAPAGGGATSTCACGSRPTRRSSARATTSQTTLRAPLTAAVLGGEAQVPTLEGTVGIKIPAGTPAGQVFRLRGHGLPKLGASGERGDLLATLAVELPRTLTDEAEGAVRGAAQVRDVTGITPAGRRCPYENVSATLHSVRGGGMKLKLIGGLVAALAVAGMVGSAEAQSKRPMIAVMDFDYGTIDNWWGQYDIGKGMADQVVNALLEDGSFRVIERKKLDTVLAEQDFAQSDRADPSAAKMAKMGKVLGVKYILAGSITKFSTEKRGGGVRVKGIGLGGSKAKSQVALTARVIDATTGEILISAKGLGESSKGGGVDFASGGFGVGHERRGVAHERARRGPGEGLQRVRDRARREEGPAGVAPGRSGVKLGLAAAARRALLRSGVLAGPRPGP